MIQITICKMSDKEGMRVKEEPLDFDCQHVKIEFEIEKYEESIQFTKPMEKHSQQHQMHSGMKYHCSQCNKYFAQYDILKIHLRTHTLEKPYQCSQCEKAFTLKNNLRRHLKVHSGDKSYICNKCEKAFSSSYYLSLHIMIHTGSNSVIKMENSSAEEFVNIKKNLFRSNARTTDRIVASKEGIKHRNSDSKIQVKPDECTSDNYQFLGSYCQLCDFRPKERKPRALEDHMRTHTGDKPFSCAICDFSTSSKYYLETHMRKHTGEKPFHCPKCQYSASRKQTLNIHLLTHTNEKPFACTECTFKCAREKGLQQHWSFYCKFQHFRCSVCEYKCRKLKDLKNHVLTHPAAFPCLKCDYMGRCKEDLERHNVTHTKRVRKSVATDRCICSQCGISFVKKSILQRHILRNNCK